MLIGLLRLGFHEPGVYGLGRLMWRQVRVFALLASRGSLSTDTLPVRKGIVWLFLATIAEIPPVVSVANSMHACFHSTDLEFTIVGVHLFESER
jgi:hypothetical protein